ncbi:MAG: SGNH/GDSL hydrolase family protein [Chloroflexota bacterium]|nr:SGNH/GDSL hydrolase family protein [Chloroflexota bacterium]
MASPGPTVVVGPDAAASTRSTLPASSLAPFHVAVLGDSLAAGDFGPPALEDRWWSRAGALVRAARPDRDVVVSNFGLAGSGIEHVEKTITTLNAREYQVAIVMEGRNDYQSNADWSLRLVKVIQSLERQGIAVMLVTIPPILSKGELLSFSRNPCIRMLAGTTRLLLDLESRWYAAGPTVAEAWYTDTVHASLAGQVVEAELAGAALLKLVK